MASYVTFQMAEVLVPRQMFVQMLSTITRSGRSPPHHEARRSQTIERQRQGYALTPPKHRVSVPRCRQLIGSSCRQTCEARFIVAKDPQERDPGLRAAGNPGNVGLNFSDRMEASLSLRTIGNRSEKKITRSVIHLTLPLACPCYIALAVHTGEVE
jgi:hypothetical protein